MVLNQLTACENTDTKTENNYQVLKCENKRHVKRSMVRIVLNHRDKFIFCKQQEQKQCRQFCIFFLNKITRENIKKNQGDKIMNDDLQKAKYQWRSYSRIS